MENRNTRRVIENVRAGDDRRWVAALAAKRVNGAETAMLAQELACSHDTIENLRYAGEMYVGLLKICPYDTYRNLELRNIRDGLSVSHFARMGRLKKTYTLDWEDCLYYLYGAYVERYSTRKLAYHVEIENEPAPEYFFLRPAQTMYNAAEKVITSIDVPEGIREAAKNYKEQLDIWREENDQNINVG